MMFEALRAVLFRRRRMKRIIRKLPAELERKYGGAKFYTVKQALAAAAGIGIGPRLQRHVVAAACSEADFVQAYPADASECYWSARRELASLTRLASDDFTMASLRQRPRNHWVPAEPTTTNWG